MCSNSSEGHTWSMFQSHSQRLHRNVDWRLLRLRRNLREICGLRARLTRVLRALYSMTACGAENSIVVSRIGGRSWGGFDAFSFDYRDVLWPGGWWLMIDLDVSAVASLFGGVGARTTYPPSSCNVVNGDDRIIFKHSSIFGRYHTYISFIEVTISSEIFSHDLLFYSIYISFPPLIFPIPNSQFPIQFLSSLHCLLHLPFKSLSLSLSLLFLISPSLLLPCPCTLYLHSL